MVLGRGIGRGFIGLPARHYLLYLYLDWIVHLARYFSLLSVLSRIEEIRRGPKNGRAEQLGFPECAESLKPEHSQ